MILCVTIEQPDGQFASVLNERVINTSRHKDYSLFHWKAHDVNALKTPIDKFAFIDANGALQELIESTQLKKRGVNYATAVRGSLELIDEEAVQISRAIELVQTKHGAGDESADSVSGQGGGQSNGAMASGSEPADLQNSAINGIATDGIEPGGASDAATGLEADGSAEQERSGTRLSAKKRKRR